MKKYIRILALMLVIMLLASTAGAYAGSWDLGSIDDYYALQKSAMETYSVEYPATGKTKDDSVTIYKSNTTLSGEIGEITAAGTEVTVLGLYDGMLSGLFNRFYKIEWNEITGYVKYQEIELVNKESEGTILELLAECKTVEELKSAQIQYDTIFGEGALKAAFYEMSEEDQTAILCIFDILAEEYYGRLAACQSIEEYSELKNVLTQEEYAEFMDAYKASPSFKCYMREHTHSESCYNAQGRISCGFYEHTHDSTCFSELVLPTEIAEWALEVGATQEMIARALMAGGLDCLVLEGNSVVYVRTGKTIAQYDGWKDMVSGKVIGVNEE